MSNDSAASQAQHLSGDAAFKSEVLESDQPVMVDFFAQWCGPCQMAAPIMDRLAGEYSGKAKIIKIDVDEPENRSLAMQYGVMSIPTVIMVKGGEVIARQIGFIGEDGYRGLIEQGLAE